MANLSYEEHILKKEKQLHMSVFAQCVSPDGKYLLAGNNYGTIAVFNLHAALASDATEDCRKPIFTFKAYDGAIFALLSTENFLICGGSGDIKAWAWKDIQQKTPRIAWSLSIPLSADFGAVETNGVAYSSRDDTLYSGGGDSVVHVWDLESGICKHSFKDHTDYIHSVTLFNTSAQVASGSEDGTVRIWDTRTAGEPVAILEPSKHEECVKNPRDRWISCVAVDPADDWLICGGGPSLSLWHLRSLSPTTVFDAAQCQPHIVLYHDDAIISAGTSPRIYHWHVNGDNKLTTPCTASDVYSVVVNTESESNKVLCASGAGSKIDVYTNFGYKAFSVDFC